LNPGPSGYEPDVTP